MTKIYLASMFLFTIMACATGDTNDNARLKDEPLPYQEGKDAVSIEAKLAGAQVGTSQVTEVKFEKGKIQLSADQTEKIEKIFKVAGETRKIARITLVAWGDNETNENITEEQKKLAQSRAEQLEKDISAKHSNLKFKIINMAEKPSAINQFLKTKDARIQSSFEKNGPQGVKSSRAVVIISTRKS